jgi:hypothetical protein
LCIWFIGHEFLFAAAEVLNVFQTVLRKIEHTDLSIGIVTPYSGQRKAIYDKISSSVSPELLEKHDVNGESAESGR